MSEKSSFLKEKGKSCWKELTREDMNEYYRKYYSQNKSKYTQFKTLKKCETCNMEVKNIYTHRSSRHHNDILRIIEKYGPKTTDATELMNKI